MKGLVLSLAMACRLASGESANRIELNDGWLTTSEESLVASREFSIPMILNALDGQRRDLVQQSVLLEVAVAREPGLDNPYLQAGFEPKDWEEVRVPHDGGIEHAFSSDLAPLDAFLPSVGTRWYRYAFSVTNGCVRTADGKSLPWREGDVLSFDCDGAMSFPILWLNGHFAGGWPNGYMPWRVDLTPFVKPGKNVIFIRTHRPANFARWHVGNGLTRRCYLERATADHVVPDSVFITTPVVTPTQAVVRVSYAMSRSGTREKTFVIKNPHLWDVDDPHLYAVDVEGVRHRYGIRSIKWTADDGFHLNGRRVQLRGLCFHQELGSLGAVANRTAIRRRLEKAKALGMNAMRMSHYPHASDWYELCDEMGILVMDELTDAWSLPKLYSDYSLLFPRWHERDLRTMIRRHRNHPCVVLWSVGNEIWESRSGEHNWPLFRKNGEVLNAIAHQEDPTRPTTCACDNQDIWKSPCAQFADVYGFNYKPTCYADYRKKWPDRPVVGTETMCTQTTRGEYDFQFVGADDWGDGLPGPGQWYVNFHSTSYGLCTIRVADREWTEQDANPYVAGSFAWTAFDYLGSPGAMISRNVMPNYTDPAWQAQALADKKRYGRIRGGIHSCPTGLFDLAGLVKDEAYLYLARWKPDVPTVHILPHWNWPDRVGKVTPVYVYSSGDEVELFVNGVSQGRKRKEKGLWRFRFNDVVYQPGEVRAVAYCEGISWAEEVVKTAGEPARLELIPERSAIVADGEDVGYVTLRVVDKDGNFCPTAKFPVEVSVSGAGRFLSIENGDETDFSWFRDPERKTFNGLLSILVRATPNQGDDLIVTVKSSTCATVSCRMKVIALAK